MQHTQFDLLAHKTAHLSPADLATLINEAAILAVRDNSLVVQEKHAELAFTKIKNHKNV
jgi:ATP-dependent Zn protease